jgi:hypothetical protein
MPVVQVFDKNGQQIEIPSEYYRTAEVRSDDGESTTVYFRQDQNGNIDQNSVYIAAVPDCTYSFADVNGQPMTGCWSPNTDISPEAKEQLIQFVDSLWGNVVSTAGEVVEFAAEAVGLTAHGYDYYSTQIDLLNSVYSTEHLEGGSFKDMEPAELCGIDNALADLESEISRDILLSDEEKNELIISLGGARQVVLLATYDAEDARGIDGQTMMADEQ